MAAHERRAQCGKSKTKLLMRKQFKIDFYRFGAACVYKPQTNHNQRRYGL